MRLAIALVLVCSVAPLYARPHVLRDGANHHLGDDSFRAREGRAPTPLDSEALRMRTHLDYVRELLAASPATRPELATRRAQLLGYLGDYIAKGTTPKNTYVAWRNPVFIDATGTICAVGYLIELVEREARAVDPRGDFGHRRGDVLEVIEDIAAAMPEVAAWVDG